VIRRFYLGRESDHTVFEAELVGLLLALDIIESTPRLTRATILLDSQAAIMAVKNGNTGGGGRYLVEEFYRRLKSLATKRRSLRLELRWIPGHKGAEGNERADEEAKAASQKKSLPVWNSSSILQSKLPVSKTAAVAKFAKDTRAAW
ncbi:hypothetical protein BDZ89DRAFT_920829, partial [Hymenopellis radicata]